MLFDIEVPRVVMGEEIKSTMGNREPSSYLSQSVVSENLPSYDITDSLGECTFCDNSLSTLWSISSLETSYNSLSESDASTILSTATPQLPTLSNYPPSISTTGYSTSISTTNSLTYISTTYNPTSSLNTDYPTSSLTTNYPTSSSTTNYPTSSSTAYYPTSSSTADFHTSSSTPYYPTSSSTTDYPTFTKETTTTSFPNVTDRSQAHDLSDDVGLIFGGIIGALSLITIVIIVVILIHKRMYHRRGSSYRTKSRVKVLPDEVNGGNYKASKILGRRFEEIDLTEGQSENTTEDNQTFTETEIENGCYNNPCGSFEAADSIYNHLGADSSSQPVPDDTYHHIDVNFQQQITSKDQINSLRGMETNYDHIHLPAIKSGAQNANYNHIEISSKHTEKCDSNYDHITVPQQISPPNLRRKDNYHHIEL